MKTSQTKRYVSNEDLSIPLFENQLLNKLTRTHISVPVSLFIIYAGSLLYWTSAYTEIGIVQSLGLFVLGVFGFTLLEYVMHRYAFHWFEHDEVDQDDWQYKFHGVHHDYPRDKQRLAMPPVGSLTLSSLILLGLYFVLNDAAFSILAGINLGYALYLLVHYSVHAYRKPKNFLSILWKHHAIHHYKDDTVAFGVSSPLWDYVFRTMPK
ncbi:MAG: sterol desaturase family protein [Bacteroidota bacterium]